MRAIILAAGKSTRLRPLTENTPKCLLEINGQAIIDYQIKSLLDNGVNEIIVVTGFQGEKIINHLKKNYLDIDFTFIENKEYETTAASYSLWLAKDLMSGGFLYLNSDLFCHPEIIKLIIKHKKPNVTAIQKIPWNEEAVNIISDHEGSVVEIGKHINEVSSHGEFIGITKLGKEFTLKLISALDSFIEQGNKKKYAVDAINQAIELGGKLHALDVTHLPAIEIDTSDDYERAKSFSDWR